MIKIVVRRSRNWAIGDMSEATVAASIDQHYYRLFKRGVSRHLFVAARQRIFRDFLNLMRPARTDRILDVGASDVAEDSANILEQCYSFPDKITACGLGSGDSFRAAFPLVRYRQIEPNVRLPFADRSFAIAASNAVLEHVGSLANQARFVQELCRVAERVFITVPNRAFPVEHHTAIPLAHYQDAAFKLACRLTNKTEWAEDKNLMFISRKRLWRLAAPIGRSAAVGYTGLLLGPFSSNLYLSFD